MAFEIIKDYSGAGPGWHTQSGARREAQGEGKARPPALEVNEVCKSAIKTCEAQKKFGRDHGAVQEGGPFGRISKTYDGLHLESSVLAAPEDVARDLRTLW
jgi:hypothetical protein